MRRIAALMLLIPLTGCHIARATVTYQFDQPTVSLTLEPVYVKPARVYRPEPQATCEIEVGNQSENSNGPSLL